MQHELKILPQYFKAVKEGSKTFELRKNDRDYKVGDTLILQEWDKFDSPIYGCSRGFYTGQEITKEVTYILEGGQYGLEKGYCILGLKQNEIILKNIDLTGITPIEQARKTDEEIREFYESFNIYKSDKTEENRNHVIEEYFDMLQASLGLLEKEGITAQEVMQCYLLHEKKIINRPRKKECKKCINKSNCKLYLSSEWENDKEAERCKTYKEKEDA